MIDLLNFHFLRPWWLIGLPLAIGTYFIARAHLNRKSLWSRVIAPHLLPYLMVDNKTFSNKRWASAMMPMFLSLVVLSLAGPTITKMPSDIHYHKAPIVICLEVSEQMMTNDIDPNRLKRAVYKINDLIKAYPGGEIALIAFAGDAHHVVPLTEDGNTIMSLARTLSPDLMPIKGVNLNSALAKASELTNRQPEARIVVITSGKFDQNADVIREAFNKVKTHTYLWTFAGNEAALNNDIVKAAASLPDVTSMMFTPDARDISSIVKSMTNRGMISSKRDLFFDTWVDLGPYVLAFALVLLLLTYFFARDHVWLFGLMLMIWPHDAKASLFDLFLRRDQQAQLALEQGDPKKAAALFEDDMRKGSAYFRAKMFDEAIEHFKKVETSDGFYNLGNAQAHKGQIVEAIASYKQALQIDPNNLDAKTNKEILEKLLQNQEKQQQEQEKNNEKNEQEKKESNENQQDKDQNSKSDDKIDESNNDNKSDNEKQDPLKNDKNKEEKKSEEKNEERQPGEEKKKEEKPLEKPAEKAETKKAESNTAVDKETKYYFDKLEQNNSLYLKRKFRFEAEKGRAKK